MLKLKSFILLSLISLNFNVKEQSPPCTYLSSHTSPYLTLCRIMHCRIMRSFLRSAQPAAVTILPVNKDDIEGRGAGGKNGHLQTTTSKCTDAKPSARLRVRGVPSTERPARHGRRSEAIRSAPGLRGSVAHLPRTLTEATRATAPLPAASRSRPIPHGPVSPAASGQPGARTPPPLPRGPTARLPTRTPPARHGAGPGPGDPGGAAVRSRLRY